MYSNTKTHYIQNIIWEEFLVDFGTFFETEFSDGNPLRVLLDMPDDRAINLHDMVINVIDRAIANIYDPQKLMDDFLKTCIYHNRYIMNCYDLVENVIRYLINKGAVVSSDIALKPDMNYGASCLVQTRSLQDAHRMGSLHQSARFQDEGHTFQIRGFIYRNFIHNTNPISYNAAFWEDILTQEMKDYNIDYDDVEIDEEKFLSAIKYEAENLWTPF